MDEALGGVHLHGEKTLALGAAEINTPDGIQLLSSVQLQTRPELSAVPARSWPR